MKYIGDLYAKIGRKYLKLEMSSTDLNIQCICKRKISETQTHRRKSLHGSRF